MHLNMVKVVNFMLCIFYHNKKSEIILLCCDMEISPSYYPENTFENNVYCALTFTSRKHTCSHCKDYL